jgi:uncharacterized membrane protein
MDVTGKEIIHLVIGEVALLFTCINQLLYIFKFIVKRQEKLVSKYRKPKQAQIRAPVRALAFMTAAGGQTAKPITLCFWSDRAPASTPSRCARGNPCRKAYNPEDTQNTTPNGSITI